MKKLILVLSLIGCSLCGQVFDGTNHITQQIAIPYTESSELSTNVTETNNGQNGDGYYLDMKDGHFKERKFQPVTERTVTTVVTRRDKIAFDWNGKREIVHETEVSRSVKKFKLRQDWDEVPVPDLKDLTVTNRTLILTNELIYRFLVDTNSFNKDYKP